MRLLVRISEGKTFTNGMASVIIHNHKLSRQDVN